MKVARTVLRGRPPGNRGLLLDSEFPVFSGKLGRVGGNNPKTAVHYRIKYVLKAVYQTRPLYPCNLNEIYRRCLSESGYTFVEDYIFQYFVLIANPHTPHICAFITYNQNFKFE